MGGPDLDAPAGLLDRQETLALGRRQDPGSHHTLDDHPHRLSESE
jgi:hypothetical protein